MKNQKLNDAWVAVCSRVESFEGIDPSQIRAFFPRLHPMAMSEDFFMLTADNDFIKKWIERHYFNEIRQALQEIYGNPFTVLIEVDEKDAEEEHISQPKYQNAEMEEQDIPDIEEDQDYPDNYLPSTAPSSSFGEMHSNFTFENFVLGDSNRMAYSMAVSVAETPGKPHLNPLFIYGKSGLGKTHLMLAIQNYIRENMPQLKTRYTDSAELLDDYISASTQYSRDNESFQRFKQKYEDVDVLLIDDVQYFQGKTQTLENVFQIFNKLTSQGKQVILSADRAPKNIDIDERYRTRFNSGGTVDIQPPEVETKIGIIRCFIQNYRTAENQPYFDIPMEIQSYIAEISSSNIRELKSAITKIVYLSNSFDRPLELEDVKKELENHFSGGSLKRLTIADIQKQVELFYRVSHADLIGGKRSRNIIQARQMAMYLCRIMLDKPYADIGKQFNRDHSTVMHSVNTIDQKIKENREVQEEVEAIMNMIKES